MGRPRILDERIMTKIAKKIGKRSIVAVNKRVSAKASKLGISPEAALILLAKEHGIGASTYQRKLDVAKQAEVRGVLPAIFARASRPVGKGASTRSLTSRRATISRKSVLRSAIEYVIQDNQLLSRCEDILMASAKFDRPVNQATLVLEDRIRKKAQPPTALVGENLVNFAFKEEISKTVLRVASNSIEDQRGFTQIIRGIVPAFRNSTHHHIIETFSRDEALRVCGFIDVLLRVVDNSIKVR